MKFTLALLAAAATLSSGCTPAQTSADTAAPRTRTVVTISTGSETHRFNAEIAATKAEQARGMMFETAIADDYAMLFAPYPAEGGGPVEASFWMKNTPSSLDIIFIRPDGTIARIAENTVPFSETSVASGEPVSAVLEIRGGRSAELGIDAGSKVSWPKPPR